MIEKIDGLLGVPASGAAAGLSQSADAAAEAGFGAALEAAMKDAVGQLKHAEGVSMAGVVGQASAQDVVEAVMAAERTLQTAIAVRNKVVEAYLEISRMQI